MTYVSRRARIIVPRWPYESDTEFLFRARRRCDGRLKRHSSCYDLRAWINDNCIKNEYLLDLMSDGEVTLTPPFQLYGRFIPVPLLFKLTQNSLKGAETVGWEGNVNDKEENIYNQKGIKKEEGLDGKKAEQKGFHGESPDRATEEPINPKRILTSHTLRDVMDESAKTGSFMKPESQSSMSRMMWEKNLMEKNLFKSTCLLTKALGKLEKIDNIVQMANEECESLRKGEIQEAFRKPKLSCSCVQTSANTYENASPSPPGSPKSRGKVPKGEAKKLRDSVKCNELLRQISGLREKLKKNQECRQKISQQIGVSQRRAESPGSPQVTELYSRQEQGLTRKLQRKLEKLVNERGRLLSDMCQALTCLNNLKKSSNSKVTLRKRSKSDENRKDFPGFQQDLCSCGCKNCESSELDRVQCSESPSSEDDEPGQAYNTFPCEDKNNCDYSSVDNLDMGQEEYNDCEYNSPTGLSMLNENERGSNGEFYKDHQQEKEGKKSKMNFVCPKMPCRTKLDADLSAFEKSLRSEQHSANREILENNGSYRPSTSPTTKRERQDAWVDSWCQPSRRNSPENPQVPGRRVKSEATMQEIEKTLRNYEQRLSDMDGLEYKVEEWKRKLTEACKWKRNMSKVEENAKKQRNAERESSSREISGLFSENRELKRQVRQLMDKSKEQAKKIQNLKTGMMKARDLETEAEELKKELSEYRNSYEHQQKCISKWESVVAVQRKEIENLMNHIRKLTTERMREQMASGYQDRRCIQRTRSYSPEAFMGCQEDGKFYQLPSEEENGSCCCQEFRQSESRRTQLRYFDRNYYASVNGGEDWCN